GNGVIPAAKKLTTSTDAMVQRVFPADVQQRPIRETAMNGVPGLIRFADESLLPGLLDLFHKFHQLAIRFRRQECLLLGGGDSEVDTACRHSSRLKVPLSHSPNRVCPALLPYYTRRPLRTTVPANMSPNRCRFLEASTATAAGSAPSNSGLTSI